MAEKTFQLNIVTPRRVVFSGDVVSFSAPGVLGGFQVLYNHAPMISAIDIGEVKLEDASGRSERFATSGGFVEVKQNKVVLLAETAERPAEIDVQRAEAARARAQQRLDERSADCDFDRARLALMRAINRLKIARSA
jgi:F-type H+-transporting ATPase subunit epsilon